LFLSLFSLCPSCPSEYAAIPLSSPGEPCSLDLFSVHTRNLVAFTGNRFSKLPFFCAPPGPNLLLRPLPCLPQVPPHPRCFFIGRVPPSPPLVFCRTSPAYSSPRLRPGPLKSFGRGPPFSTPTPGPHPRDRDPFSSLLLVLFLSSYIPRTVSLTLVRGTSSCPFPKLHMAKWFHLPAFFFFSFLPLPLSYMFQCQFIPPGNLIGLELLTAFLGFPVSFPPQPCDTESPGGSSLFQRAEFSPAIAPRL